VKSRTSACCKEWGWYWQFSLFIQLLHERVESRFPVEKLIERHTLDLDVMTKAIDFEFGEVSVRVPGYKSRGPGFDSRRYQIFWEVVGLERGPLSLVNTTEELLEWKSSGSGLESREYGRRDPLRWPRDTLQPQKLALTSPTSGGCSFGIVCLGTKATEFFFCCCCCLSVRRLTDLHTCTSHEEYVTINLCKQEWFFRFVGENLGKVSVQTFGDLAETALETASFKKCTSFVIFVRQSRN
jgi:hypothetical protein